MNDIDNHQQAVPVHTDIGDLDLFSVLPDAAYIL